ALGSSARAAAEALRSAPAEQRSDAIRAMAKHVRAHAPKILEANAADVAVATRLVDRLMLNDERLEGIATALEDIAGLPDPVGKVMDLWTRPNGLGISRV